jgi:hypothetical protein
VKTEVSKATAERQDCRMKSPKCQEKDEQTLRELETKIFLLRQLLKDLSSMKNELKNKSFRYKK